MLSLLRAGRGLALVSVAAWAGVQVFAAPAFAPQGSEYSLTLGLLGDQTNPRLSLGPDGGYVVWQDNATDDEGLGVSARALNNYLSPVTARTFRVNVSTAADQENPVVQLLNGGGAMFVWQSGPRGDQDIYARVLGKDGTFSTGELLVNTFTAGQQGNPVIAPLADGSLVVAWDSYGQDGYLLGVFAQRLSPTGAKIGAEFAVNQFNYYNQRTPAVAGLDGGGFVVAWVSEQQRFENSVDVFARRYDAGGVPLGNEFRVNATTNVCANPSLSAVPGGGFVVAWSELNLADARNGWNVVVRAYDGAGAKLGTETQLNTFVPDNQFGPQLAAIGGNLLAVWTSDRQDGSRDGVYARFLSAAGAPLGEEFRVNTTTIGPQKHPAVAGDGGQRFLVTWINFIGGDASVELFAQRYAGEQGLVQPSPPTVSALDSYSLLVGWPELAGYGAGVNYHLYVDGAASPVVQAANYRVVSDLDPGSAHSFRVAYQLPSGLVSPRSEAGTGTTWGRDRNFDGLPDDWQTRYWGSDPKKWPAITTDSDGDGASNLAEFLAGTDPTDPRSVLRMHISATTLGLLVKWDSTPGSVYQLQASSDLSHWADSGSSRFAAGAVSSLTIPAASTATYYRVVRIR